MNARTAQLKNGTELNPEDSRTLNAVCEIQAVRTVAAELTIAPAAGKPLSWAARRARIRSACSAYSDEEIGLYECMAMSHGECR